MNLQASLAFLLSVVALTSGQEDECDSKMVAANKCLGEDGWDTCEQCFEKQMDDENIDFEEGNCNAMMGKMGEAYDQCTTSGACSVTCKKELTELIDCSMAEECAGHSVHDFIMNA